MTGRTPSRMLFVTLWLFGYALFGFVGVPLMAVLLGSQALVWLNTRLFPFFFVKHPSPFNSFSALVEPLLANPIPATLAHWCALAMLALLIHRRIGIKSIGLSTLVALALSVIITAAVIHAFGLEVTWWRM
jgi:hypothetical protein